MYPCLSFIFFFQGTGDYKGAGTGGAGGAIAPLTFVSFNFKI